jgi:ribosomal protein S21
MKIKKHYYMPFHVKVRNNNIESALRQLSKTLEANEFFDELKSRMYYIKPSDKRRKQKSLSRHKWQTKNKSN